MNKFLLRIVFSFHCLIYLSIPAQAMKRQAETNYEEPSAKRPRLDDSLLIIDTSEEPAEIQDLMRKFSRKLRKLACKLGVNAPKERLAWLLTMYAIIERTQEIAWNAAWEAPSILRVDADKTQLESPPWTKARNEALIEASGAGLNMALTAARKIAHKIDKSKIIAWIAAHDPEHQRTWNEMKAAGKAQAQVRLPIIADGKEAYRVEVQTILERLLKDLETIFYSTYPKVLHELSTKDSSLENHANLINFYKSFAGLSPGQVCFLAPWLVHVQPIYTLALKEQQRPWFTHLQDGLSYLQDDLYCYPVVRLLLLCRKEEDKSFCLVPEVIFRIFEHLVRMQIASDEKIEG